MELDNSSFTKFDVDGYIPPINFLVSTTSNGILYFDGTEFKKILSVPLAYGITKYKDEWWVFAQDNEKGFVVSFNIRDQKGYNLRVRIDGLSKAIHQIDFIGNELVVADTLENRILTFREPYLSDKVLGFSNFASWLTPRREYCHMNSIFATDDKAYVLAHNETFKTGKKSEVFVYDKTFHNLGESILTDCSSAHNFYKDDEKELICNSEEGTLLCNGKVVFECDEKSFTRGLAVSSDFILVGSSGISPIRKNRNRRTGHIYVLDNAFNKLGKIGIRNTQMMDIRRVDAIDLGLSNKAV